MQELINKLSFYSNFLNEGIYVIKDTIMPEINEEEEVITSKVEEPEPIAPSELDYYGGNNKQVLILVSYKNEDWIIVKDKLFLQNILTAVQLNFNDIALINTSKIPDYSLDEILNIIPSTKVICFGLDENFTKGFENNKVLDQSGRKILISPGSLTSIAMSKADKTILWKNLQEMFGK